MGFDMSFERVTKYKDVTVEEFLEIERYMLWRNNKWNFEERQTEDGKIIPAPYPTYEIYWKNYIFNDETDYPGEPDLEKVEYYQNHPEGEHGWTSESIMSAGSVGTWLDYELTEGEIALHRIDAYTYDGIDKEWIGKAKKWVKESLEKNKLIESLVLYSYKEKENGEIVLTPCDGIIAVNVETGEEIKINTSYGEEGNCIYVPSKEYDVDNVWILKTFQETLEKLDELDLEKNLVWYSRSW